MRRSEVARVCQCGLAPPGAVCKQPCLEHSIPSEYAMEIQDKAVTDGDVLFWTIYESPSDFHDKFVARPHSMRSQSAIGFVMVADNLDHIRKLLPPGLAMIDRDPADSPVIVEVWL